MIVDLIICYYTHSIHLLPKYYTNGHQGFVVLLKQLGMTYKLFFVISLGNSSVTKLRKSDVINVDFVCSSSSSNFGT